METVRILFFADSHLGLDFPIRRKLNRKYRGDDFFRNFDRVLKYAREEEVDLVIHGGDLFDRSDVHRSIVGKAYDMLFEFADQGIPLLLVPGNHDRSTLPTSLFLQHPNMHIYFKPQVFQFTLKQKRFNIAGFPFVRRIGESIRELVRDLEHKVEEDSTSMLLLHQSIEGAQVGPANFTFRRGKDVIGMDQLRSKRFSAYLSGHIHRHQVLPTENLVLGSRVPFIYPGSIERTSFAEKDEVKGFTMLEFDESSIPRVIFKKLPSRQMHAFKISDEARTKEVIWKKIKSEIADLSHDAIVKMESPTQEISALIKDILKEEEMGQRDVQVRHAWLRSIDNRKRTN